MPLGFASPFRTGLARRVLSARCHRQSRAGNGLWGSNLGVPEDQSGGLWLGQNDDPLCCMTHPSPLGVLSSPLSSPNLAISLLLDHGQRHLLVGSLLSSTNWEEKVASTGRSSRDWEEQQGLGRSTKHWEE